MNSFLFNIGSRIERGNDIYIVEGHLKELESYSLRSPSSGYIVSSPKDKVEGEFDLIVEAAKRKLIPGVDIAKKIEPLEKELERLDTELKKLIAQRNVISPDFVYIEKIQEGGKGIPYHGKEGYDRLDFHIKSAKKEMQAVQDKLDDIKYTIASKDKWYTQAEEITSILNRVLGTSFKDYDINDAVRGWKETSAAFDEKKKADPEATRIQSTDLTDVAFLSDWIEKNSPPQDKLKELVKALKTFKSHPVTRAVENAIDDTVEEGKGKEEEKVDLTPFLPQARKELEENKPLAAKKRDILVAIRNATNYSSQEEVRRPRNKKLDTPDALGIDAAIKALQESLDAKEASLGLLEAAFKKFKKDINELSYDVSNDLLLFIDRKAPKGDYSFSEAEVTNLAKKKWEASQPKPVEKKDTTPVIAPLEPITTDTAAKVFVRYLRDHKDSKESLARLFEEWVYNLGKKEHARLKLPWNRWSNGEEDPDWQKAAAAWELKVKDIKEVLATKYAINLDGKLDDNVKKLEVRWKELEDSPAAKKLPAIHRVPSSEVRQRDKDLWNKLRPVISELIALVGNKATDAILDLIDEEIKGHEDFTKFKADALELLPSHLNPDRLPSLEEHLEGKRQELIALVVPTKEDESYLTILDKRKKVTADVMAFEKMVRKIKDLEGNIRALHTVWKGSMEKQSNLVKNISDNYRLVLGERELTLVSEWLSASIKFPSIAAACKKFTELNSEQDVESAFDVATLVAIEKEGMIKCLLCDSMIKEGSSEYRTFQGEICDKHTIRDIPISMMKIAAARSRCKTCDYAYIDDDKVDEHKKQGHTIVMEESNFTPTSEIAPEVLKDIERSNLKEVVRRDLDWEKEFPQGLSEHKTPRAVAEAIGEDDYLDGVITELQEHQSGGDNIYDKEEIYVAAKTAADHLQEDPKYYQKLRKMEKEANLEVEVDEAFQKFVTPGHRGPDGGQKQEAANYIAGKIAGTLEDSAESTKKLIVEFITLNAPDWTEDNIDTVARIAQGAMDSEVNSPAELPAELPAAPMKKEAHMPFLCPKCSQGYAENKEKCPRCLIMLIDKRLSAVDGPAIPMEVGKEGNPCIGNANMDGAGTFIMPAGQPANQSANVMKEGELTVEADAARSLAERCSHCGLAGPSVKLSKNWPHMKLCSRCESDLDKCDQCRKLKTDVSRKYGPKMCKDCERHMLQKKHLRKEAELGIIARIVKKPDGLHVYAETGSHMGGPYQSSTKARERLQQIEMFKHMKGASMDFQVGDTAILNTRVGFLNEGTEVEITACVDNEVTFIAGDIHGITKAAHLDKASIKKEAAADLEKYQWDNKGLKNQFELGDRVKIGSVELGGVTYKDKEGTIRDKVIVANDKETEMFYLVEIDGAGSTTLPEEALHKAKKAVPQTWRASSLNEDEFVKKESVLKPNFDVTQDFIDSYDNPPSVVTTRDITEWLEDPKQNYQYSKKDLKEIVKYLQSARIEVRVPVEKEVPEATEEAMEAPTTAVDALGVKKEAVKVKDAKGQVTEITDVNHPLVKKNLPAGTKITETDGSISEVMASKKCDDCKGEKAIICECMSDANIWLTSSCMKCNDGGYIKCACTNESN